MTDRRPLDDKRYNDRRLSNRCHYNQYGKLTGIPRIFEQTHMHTDGGRHVWLLRLRHMVTPNSVTPVTPNTVTQHGYATYGYDGYAEFGYAVYGYVGYANAKHIYGMEVVV